MNRFSPSGGVVPDTRHVSAIDVWLQVYVRQSPAFSRLMQVAFPFRLCGRTYMTPPSVPYLIAPLPVCRSSLVCNN